MLVDDENNNFNTVFNSLLPSTQYFDHILDLVPTYCIGTEHLMYFSKNLFCLKYELQCSGKHFYTVDVYTEDTIEDLLILMCDSLVQFTQMVEIRDPLI